MMNFLNLFQAKRHIKRVTIYISEKHSEIIFAPLSQEGEQGIIFEQLTCEVIPFDSSVDLNGETAKRNVSQFNLCDTRTTMGNASDWPALKASKEKSKVGFEKSYRRIAISGANAYNIIFNIQTSIQDLSKLEICSTISAYCDNAELGKRILKIYNSEIINRPTK